MRPIDKQQSVPPPEPADWQELFDEQQTIESHAPYYNYTGNIVLPVGDKRKYRLFRLPNNIRVVCISDPDVKQSAVSLAVNVGSSADPSEFQGMAHALEHLLFMGTAKYPDARDFETYLTSHGGYTNASTTSTITYYRFAVNNRGLAGALDRFAQFFIAPLLDTNCVARELNAIESEFRSNVQNDAQRRSHIMRATCCSGHPYSQFMGGNYASLQTSAEQMGVQLRDRMAEFFAAHYSADVMNLVIVGGSQDGATLDELVEWSVNMFSPVMNRNVVRMAIPSHPLCEQKLGTMVRYQTLGNAHDITLTFALPHTSHLYCSAPEQYVKNLLAYGGLGSLQACLKQLGWIASMSVNSSPPNINSPRLLKIKFSATPAGFMQYDKLVAYVFAYLRAIRAQGVQEWYFRELQAMAQMSFFYGEPMYPITVAVNIACQMCNVYLRPEHVVSGTQLLYEFDRDQIEAILALLNPENYRLFLGAREFPDSAWLSEVDPHFGVRFGEAKLPSELTSEAELSLVTLDCADQLYFPEPNKYITQHIATTEPNSTALDCDVQQAPLLLERNRQFELWTRQFSHGALPRGSISMFVETMAVHTTSRGQVLGELLVRVLNDRLAKELYAAEMAGIKHKLLFSEHRLCISVIGVQEKMALVLLEILNELRNLVVTNDEFTLHLDQARRVAEYMQISSPRLQASWQQYYLRATPRWHHMDWAAELNNVAAADLQEFVSEAFSQVYVAMLVVGQVSDREAMCILDQSLAALAPHSPIPSVLYSQVRAVSICPGTYVQRIITDNAANSDNSINCTIYTPTPTRGTGDYRSKAMLSLIAHIMAIPFFDQLRTQEQLGYMVNCSWITNNSGGASGLQLCIQGSSNPEYMCLRVEKFLVDFTPRLESMSECEFQANIAARVTANLELPRKIVKATNQVWQKIQDGNYDFEYTRELNAQLESLTRADMLEFWHTYVNPLCASAELTRVVVQVWSAGAAELAPGMRSAEVMAEYPLPTIALHLCLTQIGADELLLSDVGRFVATSGMPSDPNLDSGVEIDADGPRLTVAEYQRRLAALYKAVVLETAAAEQMLGKPSAEVERICALIADDQAQLCTALQMALESDQFTSSLLTSQPAILCGHKTATTLMQTFSGTWIISDYLAFKREQPLCAPAIPVIQLQAKYSSRPSIL
ncbi:metalloprotease [Coemansia sp. RSA 370]|nr:metalloprotease [Coemansia sp. RSA 370]